MAGEPSGLSSRTRSVALPVRLNSHLAPKQRGFPAARRSLPPPMRRSGSRHSTGCPMARPPRAATEGPPAVRSSARARITQGGVDVGMVHAPAHPAPESCLALARSWIHGLANRAGLRGVARIDLNERRAVSHGFVCELAAQHAPTAFEDLAVQTRLGAHARSRRGERAACGAGHRLHVERLDRDDTVLGGEAA